MSRRPMRVLLVAAAILLLACVTAVFVNRDRGTDSPEAGFSPPLAGSGRPADAASVPPSLASRPLTHPEKGPEESPTAAATTLSAGSADVAPRLPTGDARALGAAPAFGVASHLRAARESRYALDDGDRSFRRRDVLDRALLWLEAHQAADGRWSATESERWCRGILAGAEATSEAKPGDVAATALAVLAILGTGRGEAGGEEPQGAATRGLEFLRTRQTQDGRFAIGDAPASQAAQVVAALALTEGAAMTGIRLYGTGARRALEWIAARPPSPVEDAAGEVDLVAWLALTLHTARLVDRVHTTGEKEPLLGLASATLAGLRERLALPAAPEERPGTDLILRLTLAADGAVTAQEDGDCDLLLARLPVWNSGGASPRIDDWYIADLGLIRTAYPLNQTYSRWKKFGKWHLRMLDVLEAAQRRDTDLCHVLGSWDPEGGLGAVYGRAGVTALCVLCGNTTASHFEMFVEQPR